MRAVRLHADGLTLDEIDRPTPAPGDVLVRVRAAGLTRDELTWPTDRVPAIPSYELSGETDGLGDVFALTRFDRDGVAAEYAVVPPALLVAKPPALSHVEAAALPLAALSSWQALFDHGHLEEGERVLVTGATGGVGHLGLQLARWSGAHVIAMTSDPELALELGAHELFDEAATHPVDLVFDTTGGDGAATAMHQLRDGGRFVTVAEEPSGVPGGIASTYFVVEPDRVALERIAELAEAGTIRAMVDSVFGLEDAVQAFRRLDQRGKRGKVVLRIDGYLDGSSTPSPGSMLR
jgi:NADPH:quinone reductase-like Zn-dependent oxidoreductase